MPRMPYTVNSADQHYDTQRMAVTWKHFRYEHELFYFLSLERTSVSYTHLTLPTNREV